MAAHGGFYSIISYIPLLAIYTLQTVPHCAVPCFHWLKFISHLKSFRFCLQAGPMCAGACAQPSRVDVTVNWLTQDAPLPLCPTRSLGVYGAYDLLYCPLFESSQGLVHVLSLSFSLFVVISPTSSLSRNTLVKWLQEDKPWLSALIALAEQKLSFSHELLH